MKASLITIGDEILIGQILNTNAACLGRELDRAGIAVFEIHSVKDEKACIIHALRQALDHSDLVVLTGGLGPTNDDVTKRALVDFFDDTLVFNPEAFQNIQRLFAALGRAVNARNRQQAEIPSRALMLPNAQGTAPGLWIEQAGKVVVSLPGVPWEMKHLLTEQVLPRLRQRFTLPPIVHKTVLVNGIPESVLAERLADWERALPEALHLAYLPSRDRIRLRLSATGPDRGAIEQAIEEAISGLKNRVGDAFSPYYENPAEALKARFSAAGLTLASAESCTAGRVAARITSVPGSSAYFRGGIVGYSTALKEQLLGVDSTLLERHTAVSSQVAKAMAEGGKQRTGADWAVSTTGVAGPDKGVDGHPVGTLFIGICGPGFSCTYPFVLRRMEREKFVERATQHALEQLLFALESSPR